ncbi:hypothetical protein F5887DRAFT_1073245 [Amanita rubescens]|nr:hypothetical protein F5887DRAFT_1073245 [Amanita rubescens]
MNFPSLTRFFVLRRAGTSTTERDRSDSPNLLHAGRRDTWVDNFIRALDVASALSATFPPLKAATEALNVILKGFQEARNNIASLQDLVTAITELSNILGRQIQLYGKDINKDTEFTELIDEFKSCLSSMKDDLLVILKKSHKSFGKWTLYKDALSRLNANYTKHIGDLRLNFMLQLDLNIRRIITKHHCEDQRS